MKRLFAAIAIIATALFLLAAAAPAAAPESSTQPAVSVSNYTPAPTMNTNVTWSIFNNEWNTLEYSNGTANHTLNTDLSSIYPNPISIDPADIVANGTLQNDKAAGIIWNEQKLPTDSTITDGSKITLDNMTIGGVNEPQMSINASEAGSTTQGIGFPEIPISTLPSSNPAYDYITIGYSLSGPPVAGANAWINILNGTSQTNNHFMLIPGQVEYISFNLVQWQKIAGTTSLNLSGSHAAKYIEMQAGLGIPQAPSSDTWTLTDFAFAVTETPLTLGTSTQNSTLYTVTNTTGNAQLSAFSPDFPWTVIANSGYTVATSQPMQNVTEQQTSINDGSYTEQATYQGIFSLPAAPDLSYGTANVSVPLTISGAQYEVANLNGASYLTSIQSKTNGTFTFATANPNSQNSLVLEVKYTTAQWDSSSSAPSFFTLAGIEYYWWVAVLGLMGLIGLGSVAISHFGAAEETLRVPKGKYGR